MKNKSFALYLLYIIIILPLLWLVYNAYWDIEIRWLRLILPQIKNTLILIWTVVPISTILWFVIAYLITLYNIPWRKILKLWYLYSVLLPAYVISILYSELSVLLFSKIGLIFVLVLSTLPFSVISFRNWIKAQSQLFFWVSKNLKISKLTFLFKILIPLLKPTFIFTIFIIFAEVISEFWASYYLWVHTLMTWIYDLWFVWYKSVLSSQLSIIYYLIFLVIIFFLKFKNIYYNPVNSNNKIIKNDIRYKYLISIILFVPLIFTLIIPIIIILKWAYISYWKLNLDNFITSLTNTLTLSFLVRLLTTLISLLFSYIKIKNFINQLLAIFYMIPWVIISISILTITPFVSWYLYNYIILIYWLLLKFLSLAYFNISNHFLKINENLINISKQFKKTLLWNFVYVDFYLIKKSLILSFLLVFIEIIKELPITLTLAPFWFRSISMEIFFAINAERLYFSWFYILTLFLFCFVITFIINKLNNVRN